MKRALIPALFLLCLVGLSVQAKLDDPSCERIEVWAGTYDGGDRWWVTPYVRIAGIARNEHVEPLFGLSLLRWSEEDFQAFNQQIAICSNAARQERRIPAVRALNDARRAVFNAAGYVERIKSSVDEAESAVSALSSMADGPNKKAAVHEAERSLKGRFDRRKLDGLSQAAQWAFP